MTADDVKRKIRINPSKLWAATRKMTAQEKDSLLASVQQMAEKADLHGLSQFDFVNFGESASENQPLQRNPVDKEHQWEPGIDGRH